MCNNCGNQHGPIDVCLLGAFAGVVNERENLAGRVTPDLLDKVSTSRFWEAADKVVRVLEDQLEPHVDREDLDRIAKTREADLIGLFDHLGEDRLARLDLGEIPLDPRAAQMEARHRLSSTLVAEGNISDTIERIAVDELRGRPGWRVSLHQSGGDIYVCAVERPGEEAVAPYAWITASEESKFPFLVCVYQPDQEEAVSTAEVTLADLVETVYEALERVEHGG